MKQSSTSGLTVWFTGLSGSGKSTLARLLEKELKTRSCKVELLDGDVIRTNLSKGLGFSKADRDENIKRIGFVCHLLTRNGVIAVVSAISPYREARDANRRLIGRFVEVYVRCSLETCAKRDVKGLYKKANAGGLDQFTGLDDPYEEPLHPEVICDTESETPEQSLEHILNKLEALGYLNASE